MKIVVLASGSRGNATYLEIGNTKVLIDCGLSFRQITQRLTQIGKTFDTLDYVFITHEHGDHISGLLTVQNRLNPQIFLSEGTYRNLPKRIVENLRIDKMHILSGAEPLFLDGFSVHAFSTYHDALEPLGFRFVEGGKKLIYMTDTGYFPMKDFPMIQNADCYIIESNHEPSLLLDSDRPWLLKKRILDDQGHLSNEDSADLIARVLGDQTSHIILAHLSEECNTPQEALATYQTVFTHSGLESARYAIVCAKQDQPLDEVII